MIFFSKGAYFLFLKVVFLIHPIHTTFQLVSAPRGCTKDEGRPLEAGLQEQASNHLELHW
jgi:hypothetical protein